MSRSYGAAETDEGFLSCYAGGVTAAKEIVEKKVLDKFDGAPVTMCWQAWMVKPDGRDWHWVDLGEGWERDLRVHRYRFVAVGT